MTQVNEWQLGSSNSGGTVHLHLLLVSDNIEPIEIKEDQHFKLTDYDQTIIIFVNFAIRILKNKFYIKLLQIYASKTPSFRANFGSYTTRDS